jgi:hypothetical protein
MRQGCLLVVAFLVFCLGAVSASFVGAEDFTVEEVVKIKEILKVKAAPGEDLTAEEIAALKELVKAREIPPMPAKAPAPQLSDDEVTGIRDFMTQFKGIKFNGFVENFYMYNRVDPRGGTTGATPAVGASGRRGAIPWGGPARSMLEIRAFDREDNSFTLNNIELHLYKEPTEDSPIGFRVTTLYGEQAQRLTFVATDGRVDDDDFTVGEGFTWWRIPVGKGIDFKFGKFATWIGAEVWEAHWNPNFSRSLLYQNAIPFTNTGLSLGYPLLNNLYAAFFFVNGWDTFVDNNRGKTFGTQFKYTIPYMPVFHNAFVILNTSHGPEQNERNISSAGPDGILGSADDLYVRNHGSTGNWRHFVDLIVQLDPTDWLRLNTNFDWGREKYDPGYGGGFGANINLADGREHRTWWGVAQIFHLFPQRRINFALRGEYFWDKEGARNALMLTDPDTGEVIKGGGVNIAEVTGTLNIKIRDRLWIRPEIRHDKITSAGGNLSTKQFNDRSSNTSFATALTYEF